MRILATIPGIVESAHRPSPSLAPREAQAEPGGRSVTPAAPADRHIRRETKPAFPLGSIAALLALAVVAWTLAAWNDARRTERQQAESQRAGQRLAEQPRSAEEPVIR